MNKILLIICLAASIAGCTQPELNPTPTASEDQSVFEVLQLTQGFDRAGEAYFSKDMRWIIFQAAPKGEDQYQMYVAPVVYDGEEKPAPTTMPDLTYPHPNNIVGIGEPTRISPKRSRNTCGFFSPDGNSIIFGSTAGKDDPNEPSSGYQRQGGNYRWSYPNGMEIFRADGWEHMVMNAHKGLIVDLAKHPLTDNHEYDAEGSFSPNGRWIVYTSKETGDLELFAMRSDGTKPLQLTHTPGYDGGPFFSPDGKKLVYRSDRKGNDLLQIFVADIAYDEVGNITELTKERQLTHDANVNWGPFWHPDGKHIIYATSLHGHTNYELYMMRDDGSHKTRITFKNGPDLLPAFSPDGKYLMWCSRRSTDGTPQVFVAKFKFPPGS